MKNVTVKYATSIFQAAVDATKSEEREKAEEAVKNGWGDEKCREEGSRSILRIRI